MWNEIGRVKVVLVVEGGTVRVSSEQKRFHGLAYVLSQCEKYILKTTDGIITSLRVLASAQVERFADSTLRKLCYMNAEKEVRG